MQTLIAQYAVGFCSMMFNRNERETSVNADNHIFCITGLAFLGVKFRLSLPQKNQKILDMHRIVKVHDDFTFNPLTTIGCV